MADITTTDGARVLFYCRDVESHFRLQSDLEVEAELRGLLTSVRNQGKIIFLTLQDTTGVAQLIVRRQDLSPEDWELVRKLRARTRVWASGKVGLSNSGEPSIFLRSAPEIQDTTLESPITGSAPEYGQVGNQIFVARLRNRAAEFWRTNGYVEIEPKYISNQWASQGVEPLQVVYPGFGASAYLAPTPATQLLDALVATGAEAVFATSRFFSTTFRDERSSAESLIVSAKAIGISHPTHLNLAKKCVAFTFGKLETMPEAGLSGLNEWREIEVDESSHDRNGRPVSVPTVEIYRSPSFVRAGDGGTILTLFRLVWPERRTIAEGATEILGSLILASTTIHIERMASLLRDVPVRQIRNLGVRGTKR